MNDTIKERERIKEIIKRKIEATLGSNRQQTRKSLYRRNRITFLLEKLEDDILFLIDNPGYKRKTS